MYLHTYMHAHTHVHICTYTQLRSEKKAMQNHHNDKKPAYHLSLCYVSLRASVSPVPV